MNRTSLKKGALFFMLAYMVAAVLFYWIAKEQLSYRIVSGMPRMSKSMTTVGEIIKGVTIVQPLQSNTDTLDGVSLLTATYNRTNRGILTVQIVSPTTHRVLTKKVLSLAAIPNNEVDKILFDKPLPDMKGKKLEIAITSDGTDGNAVTLYQSSTDSSQKAMMLNGGATNNALVFATLGRDPIWFGQHYFSIALFFGIILAVYLMYTLVLEKRGQTNSALQVLSAFIKYRFLLSQLVARDFKTKYKRSMLGVLWSFLNPLLTMLVQYIIFSTLFRSSIPNFAVYLLTGVIFFNFFSEAIAMSLMSIVGNASLITKVYIPKYIYPVSRVLSSTINLLLSIIPLFLVVLITKTPITPAFLLLPVGIAYIVVFCLGLGMFLASAMVYFRDTQFLWGVVSMLWMYLTPIFYPSSIIPSKFMTLYEMNPLYHFIGFVRIIIMQGVSPGPMEYLYCTIFAFGMLAIGTLVFKKTQNGFVLYI